jgi:hypothetical protein
VVNVRIHPDIYSEYDDSFEIIGEPKYKYYVEAKEIEKVLTDYLCGLNRFPIYLTVTTYDDYQELENLLNKLGQEYQVKILADKVLASTEDGGILEYNVPIIKVKLTTPNALKKIISNSFWLAETNCAYVISFSDNVSFKNEIGKDWRNKEMEYSILLIDMSKDTTTIVLTHDAYVFYLFSNLEECSSVEAFSKKLPKYTILSVE